MQVVIEVPESNYKEMCEHGTNKVDFDIQGMMKNGVVLPENHGRLIDADELIKDLKNLRDFWNYYGNEYESARCETYDRSIDEVEDAQTILESTKKGRRGNHKKMKNIPPVKHKTGEWIKCEYWSEGIGMGEVYGHYYKCSVCGNRIKGDYDECTENYCPKCGTYNKKYLIKSEGVE